MGATCTNITLKQESSNTNHEVLLVCLGPAEHKEATYIYFCLQSKHPCSQDLFKQNGDSLRENKENQSALISIVTQLLGEKLVFYFG